MERSNNVVWLRQPRAPSRAVAQSRPEPGRAAFDAVVAGGVLTGLAFLAQRLVLR
ncbi:hypothetical protein MKK75_31390 [Methylobacterium sp. J-030]|uniref:hypothetical protein n=1 Tax=Methylobacterium sp. J-030 TaxID=2836627 RepID=UPI001FB91BBE|nr:hypothetical protein [Methylobacterium sp. J-030]MCJ2073238.1 hypothetical protein [Methylobacterium sp. J-030]